MRHLLAFVCFLVLAAPSAHAGTQYDLAYYMGLVETVGGSTPDDSFAHWNTTNERGSEENLTAIYEDDPENAMLIHSDGTFVMLTSFWYDDDAPAHWVLSETRVFAIGTDYIEYCGVLFHEDNIRIIPDKRFRFSRYAEVGDMVGSEGPVTFTAGMSSGALQGYMNFFIQQEGITLSTPTVPSELTGCLRVTINEGTSINAGTNVYILAPGRGFMTFRQFDYTFDSAQPDLPLGPMDVYLATKIPQWGTGASYSTTLGAFTTSGEVATIESTIASLPIPTDHTVPDSGGATVVIPMF